MSFVETPQEQRETYSTILEFDEARLNGRSFGDGQELFYLPDECRILGYSAHEIF